MKKTSYFSYTGLIGMLVFTVVMVMLSVKTLKNNRMRHERELCRTNILFITQAKSQFSTNFESLPEKISDLLKSGENFLKTIPKCPSGGKYNIGRENEIPTCSIEGHSAKLSFD